MIRSILFTTLFSLLSIASSQDAIATPLGGALVFDLVAVEGTQNFSVTASGSAVPSGGAAGVDFLHFNLIKGSNGHLFVNGTPSSFFSPNPVPSLQTLTSYVSGGITLSIDNGESFTFESTSKSIQVRVRQTVSSDEFTIGIPTFEVLGNTTTASGIMQLTLAPSFGTTDAFFNTGTYTTTDPASQIDYVLNISTVAIPEPSSLLLISLASTGMLGARRRR